MSKELNELIRRKDAQLLVLQSKNSKQRSEIARLTLKLECVTKERMALLKDLRWIKGIG